MRERPKIQSSASVRAILFTGGPWHGPQVPCSDAAYKTMSLVGSIHMAFFSMTCTGTLHWYQKIRFACKGARLQAVELAGCST
jgi:hypothetical protein